MQLDLNRNKVDEFYQIGLKAINAAEEIILHYFDADKYTHFKQDNSPFTIADKEAETIIKQIIRQQFPDHGFLGEEQGSERSDSEFMWVIDPIDGTKNYDRQLPFFSTELCLMQNNQAILAFSNAPKLNTLVTAIKNLGAFLNDQPIKTSQITQLNEAYLSFGGIKHFTINNSLNCLLNLVKQCRAYRSFGEAWSYHLLASGKIDIIIEAKVGGFYDIAAASLIITESGGIISDIQGKPLTLNSRSIIASNAHLHSLAVDYFNN